MIIHCSNSINSRCCSIGNIFSFNSRYTDTAAQSTDTTYKATHTTDKGTDTPYQATDTPAQPTEHEFME